MSDAQMGQQRAKGKLSFLDPLARLFRGGQEVEEEQRGGRLDSLATEFESAVGALQAKVEALRGDEPASARGRAGRAAEQASRSEVLAQLHQRMRGDIVRMHERLGTELGDEDLTEIVTGLEELEEIVVEGLHSHELLPRARHAIAEMLRRESGKLAIQRLAGLLERAQLDWPDTPSDSPSATQEDIERSRRRRLAETRDRFLNESFAQTAQRAVGIVEAWGIDYPASGTHQHERTVLTGTAAGLQGQLAREFLEVLQRDRDVLVARIEGLIGKEIAELHRALQAGITTIPQANLAIASALDAIDLVTPDVAWNHLRTELPRARGDWEN